MAQKKTKPWVVVATASRPWLVVCGRLESQDEREIKLSEARCAVYWTRNTRSVFGLAQQGPTSQARVSPACKSIVLRNVELVLEASEEAVQAWQQEPWA